jgi:hypothetical protein
LESTEWRQRMGSKYMKQKRHIVTHESFRTNRRNVMASWVHWNTTPSRNESIGTSTRQYNNLTLTNTSTIIWSMIIHKRQNRSTKGMPLAVVSCPSFRMATRSSLLSLLYSYLPHTRPYCFPAILL